MRFEINRSLTGMGHEYYDSPPPAIRTRPPDELARRLFASDRIDGMNVHSNVITLDLKKGSDATGLRQIIEELFMYYRPGQLPTE